MHDTDQEIDELPQRLCNEIQLFDLCELESCRYKSGRFCTNQDLLARFEKISEKDIKTPERFIADEFDGEQDEENEFGEGFTEDDEYENGDDLDCSEDE